MTTFPEMTAGDREAALQSTGLDAAMPGTGGEASFVSEQLMQIPVTVQVVLGTARLALARVAEMKAGSVLTLDQKLGSPATLLVNGRPVATGDLFVLDGEDGRLGITITGLIAQAKQPAL